MTAERKNGMEGRRGKETKEKIQRGRENKWKRKAWEKRIMVRERRGSRRG